MLIYLQELLSYLKLKAYELNFQKKIFHQQLQNHDVNLLHSTQNSVIQLHSDKMQKLFQSKSIKIKEHALVGGTNHLNWNKFFRLHQPLAIFAVKVSKRFRIYRCWWKFKMIWQLVKWLSLKFQCNHLISLSSSVIKLTRVNLANVCFLIYNYQKDQIVKLI